MKLILFFFLITSFFGFSQKISFVTYGTNEGLPQSQVTSLVQDKDGYLWIGTLGGLARFNGKDFVTFSSVDGLLNNKITSLAIIDGVLWVGHEGGVSKILKNKIEKWSFEKNDRIFKVTKIIKYKSKILFSTTGAGIVEFENSKLKKLTTSGFSTAIVSNMQVYKGELFLSNETDIIRSQNLKIFKNIETLKSEFIYDFKVINDKIILASFDYNYAEYSLFTKKKTIRKVSDNFFTDKIFLGKMNDIWLTSSDRLLHQINPFKYEIFDNNSGLTFSKINVVFEDRNGNFWIGTSGKGLVSFPTQKIVYYDQNNGFLSDLITNINQDNNKTFWFSSFDNGLFKMEKNGKISFVTKLSERIWTSALDVENSNWFGTENGLIKVNSSGSKMVEDKNLPGWKITTLYKLNSHEMLIGGMEGLSKYKNGKFYKVDLGVKNNNDIGTVNAIESINNKIYCGTDKGLYIYENKKITNFESINKTVYCISKDISNSLWVGTEDGLYVIKNSKTERIPILDDPASNFILFLNIIENKIYFGTNNGLFIYDTISKELSHIGKKEGLVDLECNIKSSFYDRKNNKYWFGTASGTVVYNLNNAAFQKIKPELTISKILLNQQDFTYNKYSNSINEYGIPNNLKLPFSKNNLTIILDGILMSGHDDLLYQYWIEGLDENWSIPSKNPVINFSGLPSGEYTLHFRSSTDGNRLFSKEISLQLRINTPFYKTFWFILLIIIFISCIIYLFVRLKIKRETQKSYNETLEYKSRLLALEQKSLNASMNRHFIFNSLNSIQYFINSQDKLSANRYLTNFAKLIRKNLDSTVEEGSMISLSQELEGIELYLSLEAMRFKDRFEYEINVDDIDTESIKVPSMLLQPFIENSIIHGILPNENKKGKIVIDILAEDNLLIIQLDDNGVGIAKSQASKQDEMGDHKSQGMEITSKRIDLIKKLSNQRFELIGPFQITDENHSINGTRVLLKIPFDNLEY